MKKDEINRLLNYTKSKKVLRIIFLYNNEDLLKKVINIYENLYNSNRTDSEKSELIMLYIKNRNKDHIEYLIYSSLVLNTYTFKEQKEKIKQYISNESVYESIANECYMYNMKQNIKNNEIKKEKTHKKDKKISKSPSIITHNENVLKYRNNNEIYKLIKIYYEDEKGILINLIVNKNLLQYRNNYEHIKLLKLYLENPSNDLYYLIINNIILRNMSLYEQLKLIDLYLDNNTSDVYFKIINLVNQNKSYEEIKEILKNEIDNNIKIYKKKNQNK